jgi:hypothetical protein
MKKHLVLIWAAWVTQAIAWFLPVAAEGTIFPHGLPGWQAFRVALCPVWRCPDVQFAHWYNAAFAVTSAATTVLFIGGSVWVVFWGSRTVRLASAWIAAAAFVINAHWYIFFGPDRKDLRSGYFLWWFSFLLLALGLFALARPKVDNRAQKSVVGA